MTDENLERRRLGAMARLEEGLTKATDEFWPSLGSTLPYMLIGLAIGSGLFLLSSLLEAVKTDGALEWLQHKAAAFIHHLAAGFFVSAVAVFFYEWGSHVKHAIELSDRLQSFLSDSDKYVKHGLSEVLGSDNYNLIENQRRFLVAVAKLHSNKDWYSAGYVTFLTRFIQVASENAESLQLLSSDMTRHPHHVRPYILSIPGPEKYADDMLTEQMNALRDGDHYDTFSNPETWLVPLDKFQGAGDAAVVRGVHIRRMLIVGEAYSEFDSRTLTHHYRSALTLQGKGSYAVQMIDTDYARNTLHLDTRPHYGIFRHERAAVLFEVDGPPTLRKFRLIAGSTTPGEGSPDLREKVDQFENAWRRTEDDRRMSVADFVDAIMEREVRHIAPGGSYDVVSIIDSDANWNLPRLTDALRAATSRGVVVRRMVALRHDENEDHPFIEGCAKEAKRHPPGGYRFQTCKADGFEGLRLPFVTIRRNASGRLHDDVFAESCSDNLSDFLLEQSSFQYAQRFERAWRTHNEAQIVTRTT